MSTFCNALTGELEGVEGKTKAAIELRQQQILERWLAPETGDDVEVRPGQYADPATRFRE